ncbi:MAG: hypothetical protein JW768_02235 [Chitinispirillaceae bacterium]|nr:hypothetical protein [Chitinispirillaceae bacterium]
MNLPEILFLFVLFAVLAGYFYFCIRQVKRSLVLACAIAPALYFPVEITTQFLTFDEIYIIRETADLDFHYMGQWYGMGNRTSDAFLGAFSRIARAVFMPGDTHLKMMLKLGHFFLGFILLLIMHRVLFFRLSAQPVFFLYSLLFFYATLLLPVAAFSFKVFNYDLLSMLCGCLALLFMADAQEKRSGIRAIVAVVCAYLAAQEKVSASPILLICFLLYGVVFTRHLSAGALGTVFFHSLRGVAGALATGLFCVAIVGLSGSGDFPRSFVVRTIDPFLGFVLPLLRFACGIDVAVGFSYTRHLILLGLFLLLVWAGSCALLAGYRIACRITARKDQWQRLVVACSRFLPFAILCIGIVSTYTVRHYFCYLAPGADLPFFHTKPFNNIVTHFGTTAPAAHFLASIGYACAVFVNALPTAFWCMILTIIVVRRMISGRIPVPWYESAALGAFFLVPVVWGALQLPVGNRYFNIPLFCIVIIVVLHFTRTLARISLARAWLLTLCVLMVLVVEVIPFRPVFSSFRPFWSSFPDVVPEPTRGNPSWCGWGEGVMLAGRKIEALLVSGSDRVCAERNRLTLYSYYAGDYLTFSGELPFDIKYVISDSLQYSRDVEKELAWQGKICMRSQVRYDCSTLFLLNRYNFIADRLLFPKTVSPLFTISSRGYPMAWVFSGEELKTTGVSF